VVRTRVGYAGGTQPDPTYHNLGDHSETVQMDYDPSRISYEELLVVFFASHRPAQPSHSRQYASFIFVHNEEQRRLALLAKEREEARLGNKLYTEIVPAGTFYLAEEYHQKYYLQGQREVTKELRAMYPDFGDFVNSTAAARLNGLAGGHGTRAQFEAELDSYGLSPSAREKLLDLLRS